MCCIPKGTVSVAASIDKNAYAPGEQVMVKLIVDNSQSQVDLEDFSFHLEQKVFLQADGEDYCEFNVIVESKCGGIRRGERAERQLAIQLPLDIETSTYGDLVHCSYRLIVELSVPWSPNVRVSTPIQIFAVPLASYSAVLTLPEGWAPQVMPTVNLSAMQYQTY